MKPYSKSIVSRSMVIWFVLGASAAWAGPMEFDLYDATPEPGKTLTWSILAQVLPDNDQNLPRPWKLQAKVSVQPDGTVARNCTLTPERPGRYLLLLTIRDSWMMVDQRAVWVEYPKGQPLRPLHFRAVVRPGKRGPYSTGGTTVLCRDKDRLVVRLRTGKPGNVFRAGKPARFNVELTGPAGPVTVKPSVLNWRSVAQPLPVWKADLRVGKAARGEIVIPSRGPGFFRLLLDLPGWGQAWLDGGAVPAEAVNNDRFGVNVTWSDPYTHSFEFIEGSAKLLNLQNVRWLRTEYQWRQTEGTRGKYDWSRFDFYQDVAGRHGMKMLPSIYRVPRWASLAPKSPNYTHHCMKPEYFDDYGRYVEALARRYKDWIRYYSIWNEIDSCWFFGGDAKKYVAILKDCHRRIKAVDKNLKTTSSGFAFEGIGTGGDFHRDVFRLGGGRFFDILDVHYVDRAGIQKFTSDLRTLGRVKEKPVWSTEQAGHQVADRTLAAAATQAIKRTQSMLSAYAGNPEKIFQWGDIDQLPNLHLWGHVKAEDRTPRPSYFTFANIIQLLAERRCVNVYGDTPDLYAYRFAASGRPDILAMWSQYKTAVAIDGIDGTATRIDMMGVSTELTPTEGKLVMPLDAEPVYLRCRSRQLNVRTVAALESRQISAVPGNEGVLRLRLYNPWKQERTARVTASLPTGWTLTPVPPRRLAPGEEASVELRLRLADNAPIGQLVPFTLQVAGLAEYAIQAGGAVRISPAKGVQLIEAESAVRSQGQCPGAPMHVGRGGSASGGALVLMFWGDGWMEYEIPFSQPGRYRLEVRAQGRPEGLNKKETGPLMLDCSLDGKPIGQLVFPLGWATRTTNFVVPKPGVHILKVCFPKNNGDLFVDFFTIQKRSSKP